MASLEDQVNSLRILVCLLYASRAARRPGYLEALEPVAITLAKAASIGVEQALKADLQTIRSMSLLGGRIG